MSGLFGTLNTANKGLMASQTAMQTTGHNVNNANTRGYTRQRVNFQADKAFNFVGVGQLGTGVRMTSITRTANEFVNRQVWSESSSLDRYKVKSDIMGQLEGVFNEPSNSGINDRLKNVFASWGELAKNPGADAKVVVSESMEALAGDINHMNNQMKDLKADTERELKYGIDNFNATIDKLDQLNEQIFYVSIRGQEPNDLLDQRDVLIEDLNKNIGVDVDFDEFGRAQIGLKGDMGKDGEGEEVSNTILDFGKKNGKLEVRFTAKDNKEKILEKPEIAFLNSNGQEIVGDINAEDVGAIQSGSFKGNYEGVEEIEKKMDELKSFAGGIRDSFNAVHTIGFEDDAKRNLFNTEELKEGKIIEFNQTIYGDSSLIIAGMEIDGPASDGSRAAAIGKLQDARFEYGKESELVSFDKDKGELKINSSKSGNSIAGHYRGIITGLGIDKQQSDNIVSNQELLVHQLEARRQSEAGVSINEEVTDMIKFQGAYQANARVIQTIADMLDTLINRTGV